MINGDKISINLATFFSVYEDVEGEVFQDEEGNIEIYIPENTYYTSFYIKIPIRKLIRLQLASQKN